MKADIRFASEQIIRCIGGVKNGEVVLWKTEQDIHNHTKKVNAAEKGEIKLIRIVK